MLDLVLTLNTLLVLCVILVQMRVRDSLTYPLSALLWLVLCLQDSQALKIAALVYVVLALILRCSESLRSLPGLRAMAQDR